MFGQDILQHLFEQYLIPAGTDAEDFASIASGFKSDFINSIKKSAADDVVVGFKSVVCYRTGLNISTSCTDHELVEAIAAVHRQHRVNPKAIRISDKALNDYVVRATLEIAGQFKKPGKFIALHLMLFLPYYIA